MNSDAEQTSKLVNDDSVLITNKYYDNKWTDKVLAYAAICQIFVTIIGIILIICELSETQQQTKLLSRSLMQSYRPIGFISQKKGVDRMPMIELRLTYFINTNTINFHMPFYFHNKGNGILSLIGYIFHTSRDEINFREEFLNGKIQNFKYDTFYNYSRTNNLLPNDSTKLTLQESGVQFNPKNYLHILIFYKDQDGNLYDTEYLAVFNLKILDNKVFLDESKGGTITIHYNSYDESSINKLGLVLKSENHLLKRFIW